MEVLRRSSVFAAEIMDAFDRSPTDKELVAQAKALGREFVHARLLRAGLAWSAPERAAPAPGGRLAEVCAVLLRLGDELELIRPSVYRNVARQLNISLQSETVVTDAFLAVASQIFSGDAMSVSLRGAMAQAARSRWLADTCAPCGHPRLRGWTLWTSCLVRGARVTVERWPEPFPSKHREWGIHRPREPRRGCRAREGAQWQASHGARWCPCTQWRQGWPSTVCGRPSPPWSMHLSTALENLCARPWRPGFEGVVDGPMSSSVWSARSLASAPIGSWLHSAASVAS
ncbi:bcl-2-related ovarian killer protein isoform X1 [Mustela lutreola]|uniref:bcl-2-related ovarian killer protein isoform X1 n=1 Tax=Mustela lutreola TaxID=9666 RepID=UPI002797871C|nr:bcl-2-related ovarian killer protein isoform X1 [Mustela lutreola]